MKSYEWKPYRTKENDEGLAQTEPSSSTTKPSKAIDQLIRKELVQVMGYEHPIVTLTVGTLKANAERATGPDSEVVKEVQVPTGPLSSMDIELLNAICPPITKSDDDRDDIEAMEAVDVYPKYGVSKVH
ncbi:hypothetical protein BGX31_011653 [Mortierella sp. GBA43]|nr:hypothetical protein BGX31_011653 [Mortierella sp. GBA43]